MIQALTRNLSWDADVVVAMQGRVVAADKSRQSI
jgi:hypothetical protein